MPTHTGRILNVVPGGTSVPGCTQHMVTMEPYEVFWTLNAFKASLCDRAKALNVPARITWKDGRMRTRDIVFVELEEAR